MAKRLYQQTEGGVPLFSAVAQELMYGGHILSVGGVGMVLSVILLMGLPVRAPILIIPYLISQVVYTYNHVREMKYDAGSNPERVQHLRKNIGFTAMALLGYAGLLVVLLVGTNVKTAVLALFLAGGGILYTELVKGATAHHMPGLKNIYTSFFWAAILFLAPLYYAAPLTAGYVYLFIFGFLRWIVNSAFFDVKDIGSDAERGIRTIPALYGKSVTITLLHVVNILSFLPLFLAVDQGVLPLEAMLLGGAVVYGFCYLTVSLYMGDRKLRALSYIVVDAEYIFWPLLVLLGRAMY